MQNDYFEDVFMVNYSFSQSLKIVYSLRKPLKLNANEAKVLLTAKKGKTKKSDLIYKKLKELTKKDSSKKCSPIDVIIALRNNSQKLIVHIEGKKNSQKLKTEKEIQNKKEQPAKKKIELDRNYKYPTKASSSIWTVKKK
ncbi:hypothetical protein GCM10023115_24750 [Pontixanthobacter gangjinensis]|uniref:Uncharacterized protein n=1 Tax=Christiangramia aestuarii TaxID=1028746 RepID=A0A7K1LSV9_9FLAO|nr:hypothetical protein [Christiangramia aestuarii]MUP43892.1 hypothetical protein [Christiangramia aestuarii]